MLTGALPPISNRMDYVETIDLSELDSGGIPTITAAKFRIKGKCLDVEKTLGSGITYDDETGLMTVTISETDLHNAQPGAYEVGAQVTMSGQKTSIIVAASIAIMDGVVS